MSRADEVTVPSLLAEAEARSGLHDWGEDPSFTEALTLLVESCRSTAARWVHASRR